MKAFSFVPILAMASFFLSTSNAWPQSPGFPQGTMFAAVLSTSLSPGGIALRENLIGDKDCNENGTPDSSDITSGTSQDCNANGIPDECDLASGFSTDFDRDGQLDDCVAPPLYADKFEISIAAGGTQTFTLTAGSAHANEIYLLLGSLSGTQPGLLAGGFVLPLQMDRYLLHCLYKYNEAPLGNSFAALSPIGPGPGGSSSATFTLLPGMGANLVGRQFHHAYMVLDQTTGGVRFVSNAVPLTVVP